MKNIGDDQDGYGRGEDDEKVSEQEEDNEEAENEQGQVVVPPARFSVSGKGARRRRRSSLPQSDTRALRIAVGALFADDDFTNANDERALESRRVSRLSTFSVPIPDHYSEGSIAMRDVADNEAGPPYSVHDDSPRVSDGWDANAQGETHNGAHDWQHRRQKASKGWKETIRDGIDDMWKTSISVYRHLIAQYELNSALLEGEDPHLAAQRRASVLANIGEINMTWLAWLQKLIANPLLDLLFHFAILVCLLLLLVQDDHTKSAWEVRESLEEVFVDDHEDSFKYVSNVLPDTFEMSDSRSFWYWFDRRFTPALYPDTTCDNMLMCGMWVLVF